MPHARQPWLVAVRVLKWPGVRTPPPSPKLGMASAGAVQVPASWGGLRLFWALTASLTRDE